MESVRRAKKRTAGVGNSAACREVNRGHVHTGTVSDAEAGTL